MQRVPLEEPMDYKELQSDQGFLNYVFDTYKSFRKFLKGINLTLDSWQPHWDPEGCKRDPDVLGGDLTEENLGGESEGYLVQINGTPKKEVPKKTVNPRRS